MNKIISRDKWPTCTYVLRSIFTHNTIVAVLQISMNNKIKYYMMPFEPEMFVFKFGTYWISPGYRYGVKLSIFLQVCRLLNTTVLSLLFHDSFCRYLRRHRAIMLNGWASTPGKDVCSNKYKPGHAVFLCNGIFFLGLQSKRKKNCSMEVKLVTLQDSREITLHSVSAWKSKHACAHSFSLCKTFGQKIAKLVFTLEMVWVCIINQ